jgi:hypothetical protein
MMAKLRRSGGGADDDDEKRDSFKSRREANRPHALKSRQRSKQLFLRSTNHCGQLKSDKQDLERQNSVPLAQVDVLAAAELQPCKVNNRCSAQNHPWQRLPMAQNQITSTMGGGGGAGPRQRAYAGLQAAATGNGGFMQQQLMEDPTWRMCLSVPGSATATNGATAALQQQQMQQQQPQNNSKRNDDEWATANAT